MITYGFRSFFFGYLGIGSSTRYPDMFSNGCHGDLAKDILDIVPVTGRRGYYPYFTVASPSLVYIFPHSLCSFCFRLHRVVSSVKCRRSYGLGVECCIYFHFNLSYFLRFSARYAVGIRYFWKPKSIFEIYLFGRNGSIAIFYAGLSHFPIIQLFLDVLQCSSIF